MSAEPTAPETTASETPAVDGAPRWLWALVLASVAALIALAAIGVALAMAGWYRTWVALPAALALTAACAPVLRRLVLDESPPTRRGQWSAIAAVVGLTVLAGWSASNLGRHVVTSHDPGVYASTAALLAEHGTLQTPVADPSDEPLVHEVQGRFGGEADLAGPGAYLTGDGNLEYQFSHAPSVVMAAASDVVGTRGLFLTPVVAGLLALLAPYLLITRFVRSAPLALAATFALGLTTPFLYVSRSTYSEPFMLAVVATGLALLTRRCSLDASRAAAIGVCIGSSMLFRIDGQLVVAALIAAGVIAALGGARPRTLVAGAVGAAAPAALGLADIVWFSGEYWSEQDTSQAPIIAAIVLGVGAITAAVHVRERDWITRARTSWLPKLAAPVGVAVAAVLAAAWLVRPRASVARAPWGPGSRYAVRVEGLQAANGLDLDGTRSYAELTVAAIGWYLGPVTMVLAIVGVAILVRCALRNITSPAALLVAFVVIAVPPFLIDWRITPYQPWASRRFIPVVLPAFALFAAAAADAIVTRVTDWFAARRVGSGLPGGRWVPAALTAALTAVLVVPAARTTAPVRSLAEQRGFLGGLEQGCDVIGDRTAVAVGSSHFNVPIRAWCGTPAVAVAGVSPEIIDRIGELAREACEPAALVIPDLFHLPSFEAANHDDGFEPLVEIAVDNPAFPEESITRPPSHYETERLNYAIAPIRLPDTCS